MNGLNKWINALLLTLLSSAEVSITITLKEALLGTKGNHAIYLIFKERKERKVVKTLLKCALGLRKFTSI